MKKNILILMFVLTLSGLLSVPAEELVQEKLKINGRVEYDDNLIETIYLDADVEKPEVNIPQLKLTLPAGVMNITSNTNSSKTSTASPSERCLPPNTRIWSSR